MYEPDPEHFDTANRAYQRLLAIAAEHFTVAVWNRDRDERPVMMSLTDLTSGDTFTAVLMDTLENTDPHIVLAVDPEAKLTAHGVLTGATAADRYATELPHLDQRTVATTPIALLPPDLADVPDTAWKDLPADLADRLYPAERTAPAAVVVVLLDRAQHRLCAVGPFTSDDQAADWPHPAGLPDGIAHLVVGLHERQVSA